MLFNRDKQAAQGLPQVPDLEHSAVGVRQGEMAVQQSNAGAQTDADLEMGAWGASVLPRRLPRLSFVRGLGKERGTW